MFGAWSTTISADFDVCNSESGLKSHSIPCRGLCTRIPENECNRRETLRCHRRLALLPNVIRDRQAELSCSNTFFTRSSAEKSSLALSSLRQTHNQRNHSHTHPALGLKTYLSALDIPSSCHHLDHHSSRTQDVSAAADHSPPIPFATLAILVHHRR